MLENRFKLSWRAHVTRSQGPGAPDAFIPRWGNRTLKALSFVQALDEAEVFAKQYSSDILEKSRENNHTYFSKFSINNRNCIDFLKIRYKEIVL